MPTHCCRVLPPHEPAPVFAQFWSVWADVWSCEVLPKSFMTVPTPPQESPVLSEQIIRERLARSLKDVFRIMLRRPIELCDNLKQGDSVFVTPPASAGEALPTHIMGSVAFTGKVNGTLNLYFQEDFAAVCTRLLFRANEDYTKRSEEHTSELQSH